MSLCACVALAADCCLGTLMASHPLAGSVHLLTRRSQDSVPKRTKPKAVESLEPRLQNLCNAAMFPWPRLVANAAQVQVVWEGFPGVVTHLTDRHWPIKSGMHTTHSCYSRFCKVTVNSELNNTES